MINNIYDKNKFKKSKSSSKLSDVLGIDEYVDEIREILDFFKNFKKYEEIGAELPKGILLVGPPGVGKTLIAKALAGESNYNFYYISASTIEEKYVGSGAKNIKEIFEKARKNSPCIIFFDEFDSIAKKRMGGEEGHQRGAINEIL